MTATRSRPILRDPAFARLWFIAASTQIGGNMALYALTILVFATTRSNAAVSALVMSFLIPTILLSAIAGVLVDRLDVRWALIVPNAVRTLLTVGLALAGANVAVLLVLNLGISLTTLILTPAEASMIPRIVPKAQLETAMGVFNLTLQASFAVGFAFLGPLLVAIAGPSFVLGVVTVFYAGATFATLLLPSAPPAAIEPGIGRRAIHEPIRQLREGLAAISGNREVSRPLLTLAASASLVGVIGVLGPNLAASLGLDPEDLIVIVLPLGLGVVAGVFGLRRFGGGISRRRAGETGLITFGALAFAISFAPGVGEAAGLSVIPGVVVLAFCAGAAYAATTISAQTALFENMPSAIRGRVFGILASIVSASSLVPILIAGPLADAISGPTVIAIAAIGVVVVALWSSTLFGPRPRSDRAAAPARPTRRQSARLGRRAEDQASVAGVEGEHIRVDGVAHGAGQDPDNRGFHRHGTWLAGHLGQGDRAERERVGGHLDAAAAGVAAGLHADPTVGDPDRGGHAERDARDGVAGDDPVQHPVRPLERLVGRRDLLVHEGQADGAVGQGELSFVEGERDVAEPIVSREPGTDPEEQALLADSVGLALLDPDVVLRADRAAVQAGASSEVRGAAAVADTFSGRARFAQPALVNGAIGAVWAPGGKPRVVFGFTITRGKIVEIDLLADPERLRHLDLAILAD